MKLFSIAAYSKEIQWKKPDTLINPVLICHSNQANIYVNLSINNAFIQIHHAQISDAIINGIKTGYLFAADMAIPTINASLIQDILENRITEINLEHIDIFLQSHESKKIEKILKVADKELEKAKSEPDVIKINRLKMLDTIAAKNQLLFNSIPEEKFTGSVVQNNLDYPGFYSCVIEGFIYIIETDTFTPSDFLVKNILFEKLNNLFKSIAEVRNDNIKLTDLFSHPEKFYNAPIKAKVLSEESVDNLKTSAPCFPIASTEQPIATIALSPRGN